MRKLNQHECGWVNEQLVIEALDGGPDQSACHHYRLSFPSEVAAEGVEWTELHFQDGPLDVAGVNGITNEALLVVVLDRLQGFQAGQFKCRENALAITKIQEALHWLHARTRARVERGVEGRPIP